ncbi:MAG: cell division protein FtsA [Candidatus Cloacimonetes bacterium]|nr:cell division protein FtsA [Candidatus Cloacimonadota bacterium]
MRNDVVLTALDVGSTKVTAIIATVHADNKVEIKGKGECVSLGIESGVIKDIDSIAKSIRSALKQAEDKSSLEAINIFASISGKFIKSQNVIGRTSIVGVQSQPGEFTREHVEESIRKAENNAISNSQLTSENYEVIHSLPQFYEIDGKKDIINPVNMTGYHLTSFVHLITVESTAKRNLLKAIELAGYKVKEPVVSSLASGKSVLNNDERHLGAILLDIGGGTTDVAVFYRNTLRFSGVIEYGGNDITKDIAVGLITPMNFAEKIKKTAGSALSEVVDREEMVEIQRMGEEKTDKKSRKFLAQLMEARLQHMLGRTYQELLKFPQFDAMAAGLIITGGTAQLNNLSQLCKASFNKPIRIGTPDLSGFTGIKDSLAKPEYSTVIGLLHYGAEKINELNSSMENTISIDGFMKTTKKILNKIKDFF